MILLVVIPVALLAWRMGWRRGAQSQKDLIHRVLQKERPPYLLGELNRRISEELEDLKGWRRIVNNFLRKDL